MFCFTRKAILYYTHTLGTTLQRPSFAPFKQAALTAPQSPWQTRAITDAWRASKHCLATTGRVNITGGKETIGNLLPAFLESQLITSSVYQGGHNPWSHGSEGQAGTVPRVGQE